jgi:hypothetical protein
MMKKLKRSNLEEGKMRRGEEEIVPRFKALVFFLISLTVLTGLGCQPNQTILKDAAPPPTPMSTVETKKTSLEQDLQDMKTANFDYIFVFRRKDGGTFDSDDRKYLRQNTPPETNRFISSDDGKAFIAGSGFGFTPEHMDALQQRFVVEDYSKPEIKEAANKAANTNTANTNTATNKAVKTPANK